VDTAERDQTGESGKRVCGNAKIVLTDMVVSLISNRPRVQLDRNLLGPDCLDRTKHERFCGELHKNQDIVVSGRVPILDDVFEIFYFAQL
jgi:hypothetical protein